MATAEALLGREVGAGLRIERLLAVGELMAVYAAESPTRGKLCVKLPHPELARAIGGELPSVLRLANEISDPKVPAVSEEVAVGNTLGVVTPLVEGESLGSLLRRRRVLPPSEALRIAGEALVLLTKTHERRIVHGALGISHVLIADDGSVHLIGFGERRLLRSMGRDVSPVWLAPDARSEPEHPRHDLWALVALTFAMLTGHSPYGGALGVRELPERETLRSLEHIAPHAPKSLVKLIDRALDPDPSRRLSEASVLRAAFVSMGQASELLLAPALSSRVLVSSVAPPVIDAVRELRRTAPPASSNPPKAEQRALPLPRPAESGGSGPLGRGDVAKSALEQLLRELDNAVRGVLSPEAAQGAAALEALFGAASAALSTSARGLSLGVSSDGPFTAAVRARRLPGSLDGGLSAMQRAGIQTLGLLPGIERDELADLVQLFARAERSKLAPGELLGELWRADFAHIFCTLADPLVGLAADERERLDVERRRLLALFGFDSGFQLEDAWNAAQLDPEATGDFERALSELGPWVETAARAETEWLFEPDVDSDQKRLALLAAAALEGASFEPALAAFGPLLRRDLERRSATDPAAALGSVMALLAGLRAPSSALAERRRALLGAVLAPSLAGHLFRRLGSAGNPRELELLSELLPMLGAEHAAELALAARVVSDLTLRSKIVHQLETGMSGHEAALAAVAQSAEVEPALEIVRLLGRIDTLAARQALDAATKSPHLVIRCEALGLRGPADQLRQELKQCLEDAPEQQRIESLRALADAGVRVAAPAVALRLKANGLDSLIYEERRALFGALCRLGPTRAESIARDVLAQGKLLTSSAREDTRALAAWALGLVGDQDETVELLDDIARRRWGASEKVRETAEAALVHVRARLERPSGGSR